MNDNGNPNHDCREDPYAEYDKFEEMSRLFPSQNKDRGSVESDGLHRAPLAFEVPCRARNLLTRELKHEG